MSQHYPLTLNGESTLGDLNLNNLDPVVPDRILDFLNHAGSASEIAGQEPMNRLEQETGFYCGTATAQMILDFLHGLGGAPTIDQDTLWATIQTHVQGSEEGEEAVILSGAFQNKIYSGWSFKRSLVQ